MGRKPIFVSILKKYLPVFIIFFYYNCFSQPVPDSNLLDLNKISTYEVIRDKTEVAFVSADSALYNSYRILKFQNGSAFKKDVPAKFVNKKLILRFRAANRSDIPDSIWFFPGFYFSSIQLYRLSENELIKVQNIEPDFPDSMGYRL